MGSLVQEMQQVVQKNLKLPPGYTVTGAASLRINSVRCPGFC